MVTREVERGLWMARTHFSMDITLKWWNPSMAVSHYGRYKDELLKKIDKTRRYFPSSVRVCHHAWCSEGKG